jgi:hypothetical protein
MNQISDSQGKLSLQTVVLRIMIILSVFTCGGLVSMIIVNRLLVAQLTVYEEISMTSASTIINFMDDIAPYLAGYIVGFSILSLVTLAVWVLSKVPVRYRRYGAALLAISFVIIGLLIFGGRQSTDISLVQMTPTPIP